MRKKLFFTFIFLFSFSMILLAREITFFDDDANWDDGFYRVYPASAYAVITPNEKHSGLFSLKIGFAPNVWSGVELGRNIVNLESIRHSGSLTFWIKGETGKESNISVALMDSLDDGLPLRAQLPLSSYCKISTEWQEVAIPLSDFSDTGKFWDEPSQSFKVGKLQWNKIAEVNFDISPTNSDSEIIIYVDDIKIIDKVKSTKLPTPKITKPLVFFDENLGEGITTAHYPAGSSDFQIVKGDAHSGKYMLKAVLDPHKYSGVELMSSQSYSLKDIKDTGAVEVWLKGTVNTPEFYIGLVNSRAGNPVVSAVSIDKHLKISNTKWQKLSIPLSAFPNMGSYWDEEKQTTLPGEFRWDDFAEIQFYAGPSWGGETVFYIDDLKILPEYIPDKPVLKQDIKKVEKLAQKVKQKINYVKKRGIKTNIKKAQKNYKKGKEYLSYSKKLINKNKIKKSYQYLKVAKSKIEKAYYNTFYSKKREGRGIWIQFWSLASPEEIKRIAKILADAHFNFVGVEGYILGGYTIWPTKVGKQLEQFQGWDPLKILIEECHKYGIEVHLWSHIFRAGNKSPLFETHPDWIEWETPLKEFDPSVTYWICPARKEYREYYKQFVKELIDNYDIDGIQYDYIRYPESPKRSCFYCRGLFKEKTGIDPWKPGTKNNVEEWMKWNIYRENLVTEFVREVSNFIRSYSPRTYISAAVWPQNQHGFLNNYVLQDWETWIDYQYIDFLCPMEYFTSLDPLKREVKRTEERVRGRIPVYHGLGQYLLPGPFDLMEQIEIIRNVKGGGFILFALNSMDEKWYGALKAGATSRVARTPHYIGPTKKDLERAIALRKSKIVKKPVEETMKIKIIPIPQVKIPYINKKPKIDGKITESVWKKAARIGNFWYYDGSGHVEKKNQTYAYIYRDKENIYYAIYCYKANKKYTENEKDGGKVWEDDSIELFFDPDNKGESFVQFGANSLGYRFSSIGNINFKTATSKTKKGWIIEVALPFSVIGRTPKKGDVWGANVCRSEYTLSVPHMNWSCTYGSFLTPSRFGKFIFE